MLGAPKNKDYFSIKSSDVTQQCTLSWSSLHVVKCQSRIHSVLKYFRRSNMPFESTEQETLLTGVSGYVEPGKILAVMGGSGVGKTTLLKVLNGLDDPNVMRFQSGLIAFNGKETTRADRLSSACIGHVEQDQVFIETLTLEEHLIFQAMLRLYSPLISDGDRHARVREIIGKFNLEGSLRTCISCLSGGERKRLAMATIALVNPPVMLIDEPTSGLDTYSAKSILRIIRTLAVEYRRSIVVVLHQPTSEMFQFIDYLCVLVPGGRQAFFGDVHHEAVQFFSKNCNLKAPSLDGFIEQLAAPRKAATEDVLRAPETFSESIYIKALASSITSLSERSSELSQFQFTQFPKYSRQIKWLLWRLTIADVHNSIELLGAIIKVLIPAIFFGLLYFNLPGRPPPSAYTQNVNAALYLMVYIPIITCAGLVAGTIPQYVLVFVNDTQHRMYNALPFYLTIILRNLILFFIISSGFISIIYWCAAIRVYDNRFWHYIMILLSSFLTINVAGAMSTLVAALSSTIETATIIIVTSSQLLLLFSDFYLDLKEIPAFFHIFQYLSPFYYGYSIVEKLQWGRGASSNDSIYFSVGILLLLLVVFHLVAFSVVFYRGRRIELIEKCRGLRMYMTKKSKYEKM